jgi:hypothetical protein
MDGCGARSQKQSGVGFTAILLTRNEKETAKMRQALLVAFTLTSLVGFAQQPAQPQSVTHETQRLAHSCLAVRPIGSHAFRNIMLIGVAGALISHQQYQVIDAVNYPARVGQKFHGNDLQTISSGGTKVAILDKHYTSDDLHNACQ